jgi:hypothetical protein
VPDGTERMTVDQYRAELARGTPAAPGRSPEHGPCPGCARLSAMLTLVRELLDMAWTVHLEYRFHPSRKWRFDLAIETWLDGGGCGYRTRGPRIGLEIDGGGWVHGAHHRAKGRANDNTKDAEAQRLGWRVLRVTWEQVANGEALELIRRQAEGSEP